MKKQTLITGALTVLGASLITRILGFVFRIYIADKLGAQGMGLYQLITTLYMLLITFSTSGVNLAVSKMVAEQLETNKYGSSKAILRMSICWALFVSISISVVLFILADPIGTHVLGDERTILSLRCLAPGIPFLAVSSCLKGYFFAMRNSFKPSSATVIEQVSKMIFIMCVIGIWLPLGDSFACAAVSMGMTIGEIISCAYIIAAYYSEKNKSKSKLHKQRKVFREILSISMPIQTSSTFHSALRLAENLLILEGLRVFTGGDGGAAISTYGVLKGMVLPLLLFPTSILQAIVTVLIPEMASANAGGKKWMVKAACGKTLKITTIMGICIAALFLAFPQQLGSIFYNEPEVGSMISKLCLLCPLMYLEMVTVGILNSIGQQTYPMRYSIADSILRIVFIWIFVPKGGIDAFLWIMVGSNLFTSLLNLKRLLKVTGLHMQTSNWFLKPILASSVAAACSLLVYKCFLDAGSGIITMGIICFIMCVLYFILLVPLGCLSKKEIQWTLGQFKGKKCSK